MAHHGWSIYQDGFVLTGVIKEIRFMNPHDSIVLEDESGKQWKVLFAPPYRNETIGFTKDSLQVGWTVTLHGQRHAREDVFEMKTEVIEHAGEVIYEYPHPRRR
jgi:hypothetical protein